MTHGNRLRGLGLLAFLACCSKPNTDSRPSSLAPESSTLDASSPDSAVPKAVIALAPGDDLPPTTPDAPANTLDKIPPELRANGYAPRVATEYQSVILYDDALKATHDGPTGPGLLVCEAGTEKRVDTGLEVLFLAAAADLDFDIQFHGLTIKQSGPEDRQRAIFTLPLVSLVLGDVVAVHLWDRDGENSRDDIGSVQATFAGKVPFSVTTKKNHLSCGHIPQAVVEVTGEYLADALRYADKEIGELAESIRRDGVDDDPHVDHVARICNWKLSSIAAFVGWGDPRVVRRSDWCRRLSAQARADMIAFVQETTTGVAQQATSILAVGETILELGRPSRDCKKGTVKKWRTRFGVEDAFGTPNYPCIMQVPVKNVGNGPLTIGSLHENMDPHLTIYSYGANGDVTMHGALGVTGGSKTDYLYHQTFPPGAAGMLVFGADQNDHQLWTVFGQAELTTRGGMAVMIEAPHASVLLAPDAGAPPK